MDYCYNRPDCSGEDCKSTFEILTRKAVEYSEISELFCGNLEAKIVKRNANNGNLAYEVFRGKFESLKESIRAIYVMF